MTSPIPIVRGPYRVKSPYHSVRAASALSAEKQRLWTGLLLQRKHWCETDRQADLRSEHAISPASGSGLVVVQAPDCGLGSGGQSWILPTIILARLAAMNPGRTRRSCPRSSAELPAPAANLDELRREWRRLYHSEPPRISRDLLIRGIGYRLQEIQHGGLGKSTRRKLKTLAKMFRTEGRVAPDPGLSLKPAPGWCANGTDAPTPSR